MAKERKFIVVLKTGNKTIEDAKKVYEGSFGAITQADYDNYIQRMAVIDGATVLLVQDGFSGDNYGVISFHDNSLDKYKEFCYLAEQDPFFGAYENSREEFDADWESGEYEFTGTLELEPHELEITEEIIKFKPIRDIYWDNGGQPKLVFHRDRIYKGELHGSGEITATTPYFDADDYVSKADIELL